MARAVRVLDLIRSARARAALAPVATALALFSGTLAVLPGREEVSAELPREVPREDAVVRVPHPSATDPTPASAPDTAARVHAAPLRLVAPAAGVDAALRPVGTTGEGEIEVPVDVAVAGWFAGGVRPGERGPAVVVGHVDSADRAGVFHRLHALERGDEVTVVYDDGTKATFVVYHRSQHSKDAFPTAAVYANTSGPELRLVTCGGAFDRRSGHYRDNVIVWAAAAAPEAPQRRGLRR